MKPTIFFHVSFLVFIITTQSLPSIITTDAATATPSENAVYDISGEKVLSNVPYYIGPVIWAKGGGIKLTDMKNINKVCPYYVVQDPAEVNRGGQFRFTLIAKHKYLLTSYILSIDSGSHTGSCNETTIWQISDAEAKAPSNLINTGGLFDTAASCFQIVDYPKPTITKIHSYMLQHCPSFCGAGPHTCFNISLYVDNGVRHLATSGTPFEFVFQKPK